MKTTAYAHRFCHTMHFSSNQVDVDSCNAKERLFWYKSDAFVYLLNGVVQRFQSVYSHAA